MGGRRRGGAMSGELEVVEVLRDNGDNGDGRVRVVVTDSVAESHRLMYPYMAGVYRDPPDVRDGEADVWHAVYIVDGTEYWVQPSYRFGTRGEEEGAFVTI